MLLNTDTGGKTQGDQNHRTFVFDEFVLDIDRGALLKDGMDIPLRPKSFEVLTYFVRHCGVLLSKREVLTAVWGGVVVTEDSLTQCLIEIRKALGDSSRKMLRTVPRRGYILDVAVAVHGPQEASLNASETRPLFSGRRPSAWSMGAILLLALAVAATWWNDLRERPPDRTGENSTLSSNADSVAMDHYLRGKFFHGRRAMGDPERSVRQFREALKQDPELTHAWVGLAGALWVRSWESDGYISEDVLRSSKSALDRAIALSPNHAEAHVRLYGYYCHRFEMEKAQKHLDHAMEHGQKNVLVLSIVAGSLFSQSRVHEAIDLQRRAVALDPLGYVNRNNLAHFLYSGGLLDEALLEFNRSLDLNPEAGDRNLEHLTGIYVLQRRFDEAEKLARQLPKGHSRDRVMALIHNAEGREADVELILEGLSASVEAESAATLTEIYAQLVLFDESVHWLELATERKLITSDAHQAVRFLSTMRNSPFLIPLRGDPRWDEWLSRAEEQIAVRFSAESIVTAIDMPTSPVIEMTDR